MKPAGGAEGGEARLPERRPKPWGAFAYRDFRLLWSGQFVSRLGTWMQFTSMTYFIGILLSHSEAQSSLNLGLLGAFQSLPALLLSPIGGYVADRYPRRRTLLLVAFCRSALALSFALAARSGGGWVIGFAFLIAAGLSAVDSFDTPTRQSWLAHIVPRHLLASATGVGSIANNVPLMVGPAIAGLLIGTVGVYASFLVNAVAQCFVFAVIFFMRSPPVSNPSREPMLAQIAAGMRFIATHPVLRWVVLMALGIGLFVRPYALLLATYAGLVLHVDAKAYGTMLAVGGIGTVGGALVIAGWRSERRGGLWAFSGVACSLGLLGLAVVHSFAAVLGLLVVVALCWMAFSSALFVTTQMLSPDEMRGRTVSLFSMIFFGVVPAGALLMGAIASATSLPFAYGLGGAIGAAFIAWVWFGRPEMRRT